MLSKREAPLGTLTSPSAPWALRDGEDASVPSKLAKNAVRFEIWKTLMRRSVLDTRDFKDSNKVAQEFLTSALHKELQHVNLFSAMLLPYYILNQRQGIKPGSLKSYFQKFFTVFLSTVVVHSGTAIEISDSWKYTTHSPSDGWHSVGFNDSGWQEGFGGFGTADTP